jgi:hypothetical protein
MKEFKLMKTVFLLFTVFLLSNCENNDAVEFVVIDDFPTEIDVIGLEGLTSYRIEEENVDISDLLNNATTFIEADVEAVGLALKNYPESSTITGSLKVTTGGTILFEQQVTLSSEETIVQIPASASNILDDINAGEISVILEGTTTAPIESNAFVIVVTPTIRSTVGL